MPTNPEVITPQTVHMPPAIPLQQRQPTTAARTHHRGQGTARGLQRRVAQSNGQAIVRAADVATEGHVAVQKAREVQNLVQHVMIGHAMAVNMAQTLAQGDPFLADDLNGIAAVGRMSMIQVAADFTDRVRGL